MQNPWLLRPATTELPPDEFKAIFFLRKCLSEYEPLTAHIRQTLGVCKKLAF